MTLFDQNDTTPTNITSYKDLLVGEGKKFKTEEELAKGKYESDNVYIPRLEEENENLRKELATRQRLEEVLDQLETSSFNTNASNHDANNGTPAATAPLDESTINNILDKREKERIAARNVEEVKTKLIEIYGTEYKSKLNAQAAKLGLDKAFLDDLAKSSPKAFMTLVAPGNRSEAPYTPPASSINFTSDTGAKPRTKAWYDQIKKQNPTLYWSPKTQNQMHNDAIEAARRGEDF